MRWSSMTFSVKIFETNSIDEFFCESHEDGGKDQLHWRF